MQPGMSCRGGGWTGIPQRSRMSTLFREQGETTMFDKRVPVWLLAGMVVCGWVAFAAATEDKKDAVKPPARRSGRVVGEVTAKTKNWVEVKADGEEKARRYMPRWV